MYKEYALTKSNLRLFQHTYGKMKRSELLTFREQAPFVIRVEMEVISKFIKKRLDAGEAWDCTNTLYHYYNDDVAFGEIVNVVLGSSAEAGESEV